MAFIIVKLVPEAEEKKRFLGNLKSLREYPGWKKS